ncbi:NUMOD4 motif protein [Chryseobacterium oranimense G311]|uniref:NUMOD4 domain-containing protein n=1 Tax=Chryseobacterium oranimense TaxID=421058 RepID=UPI000533991E|nr:NUMOD4 domain-containing protein [Chryseobacterium oranimense]CEJ71272.1 NUMOD4 motif protein [Chryseobacterium oranimense G311]
MMGLDDLPGEIWEEVPEYNGLYLVSNFGRVKSFLRRRSIIMKKVLIDGKYSVQMKGRRGHFKNVNIGRTVATLFIREPEENEVIKYKDGNRLNDAAHNLEWISRKESAGEAMKRGDFSLKGARNGMARLNEEQVRQIRSLKASGKTYMSIANQYDVSISCIQSIVMNKCWKV